MSRRKSSRSVRRRQSADSREEEAGGHRPSLKEFQVPLFLAVGLAFSKSLSLSRKSMGMNRCISMALRVVDVECIGRACRFCPAKGEAGIDTMAGRTDRPAIVLSARSYGVRDHTATPRRA